MANILLVEDEKRIQTIVAKYLEKDGHNVRAANDGAEALMLMEMSETDLAVLDIMIPYLDGFTLCKMIREKSNIPIVFLTAKHDESDKLRGYELGADDYITKPFSPRVLAAKVQALLKRAEGVSQPAVLQAGGIRINPAGQEVFVGKERVDLTHKEYLLLLLFLQHPGQVFSREQLLNRVWEFDFAGTTRTVDTHIKTLRQKLGEEGRQIITLIRSGYKFVSIERGEHR